MSSRTTCGVVTNFVLFPASKPPDLTRSFPWPLCVFVLFLKTILIHYAKIHENFARHSIGQFECSQRRLNRTNRIPVITNDVKRMRPLIIETIGLTNRFRGWKRKCNNYIMCGEAKTKSTRYIFRVISFKISFITTLTTFNVIRNIILYIIIHNIHNVAFTYAVNIILQRLI